RRGFITRPDCERVAAFRAHVDVGVERLLESAEDSQLPEVLRVLEIGLNHEQQHQELFSPTYCTLLLKTRSRPPTPPIGARRPCIARANLSRCRPASIASGSRAPDTVLTTRGRRTRSYSSRPPSAGLS